MLGCNQDSAKTQVRQWYEDGMMEYRYKTAAKQRAGSFQVVPTKPVNPALHTSAFRHQISATCRETLYKNRYVRRGGANLSHKIKVQ